MDYQPPKMVFEADLTENVEKLVEVVSTILESNGIQVEADTSLGEFSESLELLVSDHEFLQTLDERTAKFLKSAVKLVKKAAHQGKQVGKSLVRTLTAPIRKYKIRKQTAARVRMHRQRKRAEKEAATLGQTSQASIGGQNYRFAQEDRQEENLSGQRIRLKRIKPGLPKWTTKLSSIKPIGTTSAVPPKPVSLAKRKLVVTKSGLRAYPPRKR